MNYEEKAQAIANKQKYIDSLHYTPLIPYPYCCLCFEKLTPENIYEDICSDGLEVLWDSCISCKENFHGQKVREGDDNQ